MSTEACPTFCNCMAIRRAARVLTQSYDLHMAKVGLTISQFTILTFLRYQPGMTMAQMGEMLAMERTSLLRTLKPLSRDGYIVEAPTGGPGRKKALSLSPAGQAKHDEAHPHWQAAQAEFEAAAGRTQAEQLHAQLMGIAPP